MLQQGSSKAPVKLQSASMPRLKTRGQGPRLKIQTEGLTLSPAPDFRPQLAAPGSGLYDFL